MRAGWLHCALLAVVGATWAPKAVQRECETGLLEYCDPFLLLSDEPLALLSPDPSSLANITIEPGNNIVGVALFAFTSERSAWLLPSTVGLLTNLKAWSSRGGVRGTIPTQFGLMRSLVDFDAGFLAHLSGSLPSQFGRLSNLATLTFNDVPNLTGTVPSELGLLSNLLTLVLQSCDLQGALPSELATLPLDHMELQHNGFTGTIPDGMRSRWVALAHNQFTGSLPEVPARVEAYDVQHNWFDGTIPTTLGTQLRNLSEVWLHHNRLSGNLPSQIAGLTGLAALHVHANRLSGALPTQLGLMTGLTSLRVDQNRFSGTLPTELALLTELTELSVGENRFGGTVPSQLALLTGLAALNISHNSFVGPLPRQLALLTALNTTSVERNELDGPAPSGVWEQECDNSGLDSTACEYDCPACGGGAVELLECDWRGRGQWCATVTGLCVSAAVVLVCVVAAFKGSNAVPLVQHIALHTGLTMFAVLETFLDLVFALRSGGVVGSLAFASFVVGRVVGACLGAATLARWGRRWWQVAVGAVLCSMHASALKGLLPLDLQAKSRVVRRWIVVLGLAESLVEGTLQAYVFVSRGWDIITTLSLLFSATSLVATATVLSVFHLANFHAARAQALLDNAGAGKTVVDQPAVSGGDGAAPREGRSTASRHSRWAFRSVSRLFVCCSVAVAVLSGHSSPRGSLLARPPHQVTFGKETTQRPLGQEQRALVRRGWPALDDVLGDSGPTRRKADLVCPADGEFGQPIVCFANQVVVIFDTADFFFENPEAFSQAMQATETRLIYIRNPGQTLPPTVQAMEHLGFLGLFDFVGSLPTQVGLLARLKLLVLTLSFEANPVVSEIGHSTSLELFILQDVAATVPSQIGRVSTLGSLSVSRAAPPFTWRLPTQLGLLTLLDGIKVSESRVEGPLPSEIGQLGASLTFLDLSENELSGAIPSELAGLSLLEFISLAGSSVEGPMPDLLRLPSLRHCDFGKQRLRGSLSSDIPAGSVLELLDLGGNRLHGTIPTQLGRATAMTHLSLFGNSLDGTIPTQLGLLTLLTHLSLHSLGAHGSLPSQLGRLSLLELLHVHGNSLRGPIPSQLALLTLLRDVRVSDNSFRGGLSNAFVGDSRAVWLEDCDMSGVEESGCARECPECGSSAARLRACDGRGYGGICVPLWLVLLGVALMAGAMRLVVRRVSEQQLSTRESVVAMAFSLLATLHVLFDLLFAMLAPPAIRGCSLAVIFTTVFTRFVLATGEFFRTQLHKHVVAQRAHGFGAIAHVPASPAGDGNGGVRRRRSTLALAVWAKPGEELGRDDVRMAALDTKLFAAALVLCILDPSSLFHVFHVANESDATKMAVRTKVLGAKLVADLPHLVLQAVVIGMRSDDAFATQALVLTTLSIVLGVAEWAVGDSFVKASAAPPDDNEAQGVELASNAGQGESG